MKNPQSGLQETRKKRNQVLFTDFNSIQGESNRHQKERKVRVLVSKLYFLWNLFNLLRLSCVIFNKNCEYWKRLLTYKTYPFLVYHDSTCTGGGGGGLFRHFTHVIISANKKHHGSDTDSAYMFCVLSPSDAELPCQTQRNIGTENLWRKLRKNETDL